MAATRLDNIRPEMLKWAFQRAGFSEEDAVSVFPPLGEWLSLNKFPTVKQLQKFADKFHTPFGYLFLNQPPKENMPIIQIQISVDKYHMRGKVLSDAKLRTAAG